MAIDKDFLASQLDSFRNEHRALIAETHRVEGAIRVCSGLLARIGHAEAQERAETNGRQIPIESGAGG